MKFLVLGLLFITGTAWASPTLENVGYGCDDKNCIWIAYPYRGRLG